MWEKKVHVASSLPTKEGRFSMFIGRWQPLHKGHQELFNQVLEQGGNVLIGIRDMQPDENNPYTANEVLDNLYNVYKDLISQGRIKVMKLPDIESVNFGRAVGYDIIEWIPPSEIADISATKIRNDGSSK